MWIMTTEVTGWSWMPCRTRMDQGSLTGGSYGPPRCIQKPAAQHPHRQPYWQHRRHPHGPPPLHRHPPQHPHHRLLHQQSWPLWRKSRSRGNITTGHHLPPARISGTKRSWTSSRCWPTWTTEKTYWPAWNPLPMDADRWELVLSPEEYLKPLQGLSGRNPVDQPGTTPEASHNLSPGTRL